MQTPAFVDGQFVDGTLLNGAVAQIMANFELIGSELHTPGLLNPSSLTVTASGGMAVTVSAPSPFAVLFGTGLIANANGVVSGAISSTYVVNFTSLVPGSGTVTAYLVASYGQIGEQLTQVVGPPEGHPDFNPTFAPFQWYMENLDTLAISATLTVPDNVTTFALARLPLSVGQSTITQGSLSYPWHYASAVLNPTGVASGTYAGATVAVGLDGRLTGVSGVAYGPLAANNIWTGNNSFDQGISVGGPINANGNIVSNTGRLRAVSGAYQSGDQFAATLLKDFFSDQNTTYLYERLPDGTVIQGYNGDSVTGADFITFPIAFPTTCSEVVPCEGNPIGWISGTAPTIFGTQQLSADSFALYVVIWNPTTKAWSLAPNVAYRYLAIGY